MRIHSLVIMIVIAHETQTKIVQLIFYVCMCLQPAANSQSHIVVICCCCFFRCCSLFYRFAADWVTNFVNIFTMQLLRLSVSGFRSFYSKITHQCINVDEKKPKHDQKRAKNRSDDDKFMKKSSCFNWRHRIYYIVQFCDVLIRVEFFLILCTQKNVCVSLCSANCCNRRDHLQLISLVHRGNYESNIYFENEWIMEIS